MNRRKVITYTAAVMLGGVGVVVGVGTSMHSNYEDALDDCQKVVQSQTVGLPHMDVNSGLEDTVTRRLLAHCMTESGYELRG